MVCGKICSQQCKQQLCASFNDIYISREYTMLIIIDYCLYYAQQKYIRRLSMRTIHSDLCRLCCVLKPPPPKKLASIPEGSNFSLSRGSFQLPSILVNQLLVVVPRTVINCVKVLSSIDVFAGTNMSITYSSSSSFFKCTTATVICVVLLL